MGEKEKEFWNLYYAYICNWLHMNIDPYRHFTKVIKLLFNEPFRLGINPPKFEENRLEDGFRLVEEFAASKEGQKFSVIPFDRPVSILEVLIILAKDIENEVMHDPDIGDRSALWFWIMFRNIGLGQCVDERYSEAYAKSLLDIFINRFYRPDGSNGGAFPCPGEHCDMRKLDLWAQATTYLNKNFISSYLDDDFDIAIVE